MQYVILTSNYGKSKGKLKFCVGVGADVDPRIIATLFVMSLSVDGHKEIFELVLNTLTNNIKFDIAFNKLVLESFDFEVTNSLPEGFPGQIEVINADDITMDIFKK